MASAAMTSVQLPSDLVAQAARLASHGRSVDMLVADIVERHLSNLAEIRRVLDESRAESYGQGIRSDEDVQAILDGTLTLEDLKHRA